MTKSVYAIFIVFMFVATLSGCSQPDITTNTITGYVYMDGHAISGAYVEAVSFDRIDSANTTTDDTGSYSLNIKPKIQYYLTATYQGFRHTVWPVYMPGESIYNINITTMPGTTIEGTGYARGGHNPLAGAHQQWSGVVVNMTSVKDNTTITALTDNNGRYIMGIKPNVLYNISGASSMQNKYPIPLFHYRNSGAYFGSDHQIIAGPNETALIDYEIRLP